jgi:hypothetical protein
MENTLEQTKKYYFQGIRWVPGYDDFDFDDCTIDASDEKSAWDKLFQLTKKWTWKNVSLTHIDEIKIV